MGVFSRYAKYYNLLYRDKDYSAEAGYIDALIREHAPGAQSILDLGCGTGCHDFLLAEKNYRVTGVDMSEEMLAEANVLRLSHPSKSNVNFLCGKIQSAQLDRTFDVVLSLFHVMSYQTTHDLLNDAAGNAFRHLRSGGIFIFDFWYGPAVLTDPPSVRVKKLENADITVYRIATPVMHTSDNIVDVNYEVIIIDKSTGMADSLKETHRMRYFFLPELTALLQQAGFSIVQSLSWMHVNKTLSQRDWYGVLIVRK